MRLTIIPIDGFIAIDGICKYQPLDISSCNIPADVHALQWYDNKGWIEFSDDGDPFTPKPANKLISKLPSWANNCVQIWQNWTPSVIEQQEATAQPKTTE